MYWFSYKCFPFSDNIFKKEVTHIFKFSDNWKLFTFSKNEWDLYHISEKKVGLLLPFCEKTLCFGLGLIFEKRVYNENILIE